MSRFITRILILVACACWVLFLGAGRYVFAGEQSTPEIKEYTPNISTQEYEKRYKAVYGKFTEQMAAEGNPADFVVDDGKDLFGKVEGSAGKSCASCHGANGEKLKGVAAAYPKYDAGIKGVNTVALQINRCRKDHMGAPELKYESDGSTGTRAIRQIPLERRTDPREHRRPGKAFLRGRQGILLQKVRTVQLQLRPVPCEVCGAYDKGEPPVEQQAPYGPFPHVPAGLVRGRFAREEVQGMQQERKAGAAAVPERDVPQPGTLPYLPGERGPDTSPRIQDVSRPNQI